VHRIFVDISALKKVNDHARHDAGDEVIVAVG
jgi:PleD family two-component response regulator